MFTLKYYIRWAYVFLIPSKIVSNVRNLRKTITLPEQFYDTNSIFIHIPKTGGTSVGQTIYDSNVIGHKHRKWSDYYYLNKKFYNNSFKFCFVRNPYDRILSVYNYLMNVPSQHIYTKKWAEKFMTDVSSLEEFVNYLNPIRMKVWPHLELQTDYIFSGKKNMVDFIGRFENFEEDLMFVAKKLNINVNKVPHLNKSAKKEKSVPIVNELIKERIYYLYKKDFILLNYDK